MDKQGRKHKQLLALFLFQQPFFIIITGKYILNYLRINIV